MNVIEGTQENMENRTYARRATEAGVNLNLHAMRVAAANNSWSVVNNAMRVIESILRAYERIIGAERT